jgi:HK97 gp10 family phage protein
MGIVDNTEKVLEAFVKQVNQGLNAIGLQAEKYAKQLCPVDTGRLRNSITHVVDGNDVYVGTNVEYGKYVELGTVKQKAQPYLKPAATEHGEDYKKILEHYLKG